MKRLEPLPATSSPSSSAVPSAGAAFFPQFVPISLARPGITPSPSASAASVRSLTPASSLFHARPLSQLQPLDYVCHGSSFTAASDGLTLGKTHRPSHGDVPIGPFQPPISSSSTVPVAAKVKPEAETKSSTEAIGDDADDLFNAYMNLDYFDALNAPAMEEKPDDLDSRRLFFPRSITADSSDNSSGGTAADGDGIKEANKSGAATAHRFRSLSMETLMGKLQEPMTNTSNSEFNSTDMKKILANEKLAEMAETDPKRVKRILANRQSAARSKEKKLRYISELEYKVQTLQTEATILSEQLNSLQRGKTALKCQNNVLRIRLKDMEQQAKLREAINEALNAEVHRLKNAEKSESLTPKEHYRCG